MNSSEILAYNVSNHCRNALYGNRYKQNWNELMLRMMTKRALDDDDNLSVLTTTERSNLEATLNEPYNN